MGRQRVAWGRGKRGQRVTQRYDWNIRDGGGPSHWARRPGRKAETQRWPSGLEHPGQAAKPGTWARGTEAHREGGRRPGPA